MIKIYCKYNIFYLKLNIVDDNNYNDLAVVDLQFDDEARCIVVRQVDVDPLRDRADTRMVFWYPGTLWYPLVVVDGCCSVVSVLDAIRWGLPAP